MSKTSQLEARIVVLETMVEILFNQQDIAEAADLCRLNPSNHNFAANLRVLVSKDAELKAKLINTTIKEPA